MSSSNHPILIIKHLPDSTEERLSNNSSKEQAFNSAKPEYGKALKDSGYKFLRSFRSSKRTKEKEYSNRNRKVSWLNPLYSKQVSTNIVKRFLNLLDQHFPKQHRI